MAQPHPHRGQRVQRVLPAFHPATGVAGPHMIGEVAVEFDAEGFATVDDPAVLEALTQWPEAFSLIEPAPGEGATLEPRDTATDTATLRHYSSGELDMLTVSELQALAQAAGLHDLQRLRKSELIDAILVAQSAVPSAPSAPAPPAEA
jgi:Rho termination factor, N-terminal domain